MHLRVILIGLVLVLGLLVAAGCTAPTPPQGTQTAGATPGSSAPNGITGAANLVPSPTDVIPDYDMVTVTVHEKDDITAKIPVSFDGGLGQIHVEKITTTIYRADGQTQTATIGTDKGDEADLQGTKQTDRVVVYVSMDTGQTYKTNDVLVAYRTRGNG